MKHKALLITTGIIMVVLFIVPIIVPVFIPWTTLNCQHQDINIETGQARYSRYFWFVKVSERIKPTFLSHAMQGETVDATTTAPWKRVNTFSPGLKNSPHYVFHSAFAQIQQFELIASMNKMTLEEQKKVARKILSSWQQTGRDNKAESLIQELTKGRDHIETEAIKPASSEAN